ncbi:MAG TPA: pyridoxamine 5'-phosphate oxidase family protein [Candidatus Saccharimonadia bacterium]|nr:pyridoxamine 5'-phosphate oxidase family protein [Candidatus Saccharimonadia bacterium]
MDMTEWLEHARQLLRRVHHPAIATASNAGQPWNTPVFAVYDVALNFFWSSDPEAQHSRNIAANGRAFLVFFDSLTGRDGGLYIETTVEQLSDPAEIGAAIVNMSNVRGRPLSLEKFMRDSGQRIYRAKPVRAWINHAIKDPAGDFVVDQRYQIDLDELRQDLAK